MAIKRVPNIRSKIYGGRRRWYWEPHRLLRPHGWRPVALGDDEAEAYRKAEELNAQVAAWREHREAPVNVKPKVRDNTLAKVIDDFITERPGKPAWPSIKRKGKTIKGSTRGGYQTAFDRIIEWSKDASLKSFDEHVVNTWANHLLATIGSAPAASTIAVLRVVFSYAIKEGFMKGPNPAARVGMAQSDPRSVVWDRDGGNADMEALKAAAVKIGKPELCLAWDIGNLLGQRVGDLLRLRCDQYVELHNLHWELSDEQYARLLHHDGPNAGKVMGFVFQQGKTDAHVGIPVAGQLRVDVEAAIERNRKRGIATILCHEKAGHKGEPRSWQNPGEMGDQFDRARRQAVIDTGRAELRNLTYADLRRTAVVRMGVLHLTHHQIAAVSGHSLESIARILKHYMPPNTAMAGVAVAARLEADERRAQRATRLLEDKRVPLALPAPEAFDDEELEPIEREPVEAAAPNGAALDALIAAAVAAALKEHGINPEPASAPEPPALDDAVEAELKRRRSEQARKGGLALGKGADRPGAKLDADKVIFIRRAHAARIRQVDIAVRLGVSDKLVNRVVRGIAWTDTHDDGRELPEALSLT